MRSSDARLVKPASPNNRKEWFELWLQDRIAIRSAFSDIRESELRSALVSASSTEKDFGMTGGNKEAAKKVGETVAKRAIEKGITDVVFDRGGYLYHGRVMELANSAREAGLKF